MSGPRAFLALAAAAHLAGCAEDEVKRIDESVLYENADCRLTESAAIHMRSVRSNLAYEIWGACRRPEGGLDEVRLARTWDPDFFAVQIENTPTIPRILVMFCPKTGREAHAEFQSAAAAFSAAHQGRLKARLVGVLEPRACDGRLEGSVVRRQEFRRPGER